jgi:hypothetical protein
MGCRLYRPERQRRWITMPDGSTKKKGNHKLREIEDQIARRVYLPEQIHSQIFKGGRTVDQIQTCKSSRIHLFSIQGAHKKPFQRTRFPEGQPDHNSQD